MEGFKPGRAIPHFSIRLKLKYDSLPQSLEQRIRFAGVKEDIFMTISREPVKQGMYTMIQVLFLLVMMVTSTEIHPGDDRTGT